ncbi:MAG TPA: hypothetical protein PKK61_02340 [Defluviitaleaceae bacterium]|nr:hypothetical protein [Defluviitaleaceae bacterium]
MAIKKELSKQERILKEDRRLRKIYKNIDKDKLALIDGLICRAAYMRATLEDYEKDIDEKGYIEMFTQSEKTDPYERERPAARLYNTMNKNYQSIMKQLTDLVDKEKVTDDKDELLEFIKQ